MRWCPFARVHHLHNDAAPWPAHNRLMLPEDVEAGEPYRPDRSASCIGSDCMAWQKTGLKDGYGHCGLTQDRGVRHAE